MTHSALSRLHNLFLFTLNRRIDQSAASFVNKLPQVSKSNTREGDRKTKNP